MQLVSFDEDSVGVLCGEVIADLTSLLDRAPSWPPTGMVRLIDAVSTGGVMLPEAVKDAQSRDLGSVTLRAPVRWPNKVIAYPTNYEDHIHEMGSSGRADQLGFFLKASSSVIGTSEKIVLPSIAGREVHHEAELAIIIGSGGRHIKAADALTHVFGYSCLLDIVVRGKEERVMRKSFDSFCPMGPGITTADRVPNPGALDITLSVNGNVRQSGNTADLIVGVPEMIELASSVMTLCPGDIIATGTPAGVGPLVSGDWIDMTISRVGSLRVEVTTSNLGSNLAFEGGQRAATGEASMPPASRSGDA